MDRAICRTVRPSRMSLFRYAFWSVYRDAGHLSDQARKILDHQRDLLKPERVSELEASIAHLEAIRKSGTREDIAAAAALLPQVDADERAHTLVHTAELYGISSLRAVRAALRVARCFAALDGRRVTTDADVATAAALVLGPRATRLPAPPPEASDDQPPPPPPPDESQNSDDNAERDDQDVRELEERIIEAQISAQTFSQQGFKEGETLVVNPRKARVFVADTQTA